jgi:hypothetical protein
MQAVCVMAPRLKLLSVARVTDPAGADRARHLLDQFIRSALARAHPDGGTLLPATSKKLTIASLVQ